jgi:hypothetical protein
MRYLIHKSRMIFAAINAGRVILARRTYDRDH